MNTDLADKCDRNGFDGGNDNYHFLFEQATDAIMVTDFQGNFKDVNSALCNMFGYTKKELLQLNVRSLLDPRHLEKKPLEFNRLAAGENVFNERRMLHKNGSTIFVEANSKKFMENRVLAIARDISERKKVEEVLKQSEANLHTIFDTTDTIYVLMDHDLRIISYNPRAFAFAQNELKCGIKISEYILDYFAPEKQPMLLFYMKEALAGKHINYEISYPQENGNVNWYHVRMFPISRGDKNIYGLMMAVSDVTGKKILEKQLLEQKVQEQKTITRAVLQAQEIQRNQFGQELHDNVNQVLSVVKLYLDMMDKSQITRNDLLDKSKEYINNVIQEIRSISRRQVTPQKTINIKDLVNELITDLNLNTESETRFHVRIADNLMMDEDLKLNIYRVIQEQTNNILKYAHASQATITIHQDSKNLYLSIIDNGKGFDPFLKRKGIGIANIVNRIGSFNGEVLLDSGPGNGCKLRIRIPNGPGRG